MNNICIYMYYEVLCVTKIFTFSVVNSPSEFLRIFKDLMR